ncbi:hypothetical protein VNI00_019207 [Paramarasmius palmivorus]|uniref:BTB domain-containing protein n=1 Tax=Paramarasmius palmivorus TaxID=297713 RepID=A0AAW0ARQ1_9AGAR
MEGVLDDHTDFRRPVESAPGGDELGVNRNTEGTSTLAVVRNAVPPYSYRRGREFEFQIFVNGEDCNFEVPASLMCTSSGYFSDICRSATVDTSNFDCVRVNVLWNRDVVFTVLELIYRLDVPEGILGRLLERCKSENELERTSGLAHALSVLNLAEVWRIPRIKRLVQLSLCTDNVIPPHDLQYVREEAAAANAVSLVKYCDAALARLNDELRGV